MPPTPSPRCYRCSYACLKLHVKAHRNDLQDRTIRLWNPHKGTAIKTYLGGLWWVERHSTYRAQWRSCRHILLTTRMLCAGHGYDVRDVCVSSDNSKCARVTSSSSRQPCDLLGSLHNRATPLGNIQTPGCRFASCGGDRQIFLWDVATGRTIRKLAGHDGVVNSVRQCLPHPCFRVSGNQVVRRS